MASPIVDVPSMNPVLIAPIPISFLYPFLLSGDVSKRVKEEAPAETTVTTADTASAQPKSTRKQTMLKSPTILARNPSMYTTRMPMTKPAFLSNPLVSSNERGL
jgi:hypothetical protein